MAIPFTKMHGAGNDYIFIDCMSDKTKIKNPAELARQMSPPHFGIGADGIVLILPSSEADARMRMFNADGSEGKMCGNALRCIGRFLYERGYTGKTALVLETASGIRRLWLKLKGGRFVSALAELNCTAVFRPKVFFPLKVGQFVSPVPPVFAFPVPTFCHRYEIARCTSCFSV